MISLQTKTIRLGEVTTPIKEFVVWFQTPMGLCTTLDEALNVVQQLGLENGVSIHPVPVALGESVNGNILYEQL